MDETTGDMRPPDPYFGRIPDADADTDDATPYVGDEEDIREGDDVTYADLVARGAGNNDVTPGESWESSESTDELREEIAQTRANMGGTIDAIQQRLNPQELTRQAKDAAYDATLGRVGQTMSDMGDTARESGYTLLDTIRQNPIPAALVGVGVGWLVMKARENGERRAAWREWRDGRSGGAGTPYAPGYGSRYSGRPDGYQSGVSRAESGPSLGDRAQAKVSHAQDKLGQATDTVSDKAQQMGSQLQDQAQQMANQAQAQAYRARGWFARTMDENPLALGLVAVAAGALAGMAVPETDQEREWMGPARDQLVEKAQNMAQDTAQKAQQVAQQATNAATDAAKREAKNQNLVQQ